MRPSQRFASSPSCSAKKKRAETSVARNGQTQAKKQLKIKSYEIEIFISDINFYVPTNNIYLKTFQTIIFNLKSIKLSNDKDYKPIEKTEHSRRNISRPFDGDIDI